MHAGPPAGGDWLTIVDSATSLLCDAACMTTMRSHNNHVVVSVCR
jgi:hypothetical protein